jgi:hypothetical protein
MTKSIRVTLTPAEVIELLRALELISQEDAACDVNMDAASVAAKASALQKLERVSGLQGPGRRLAEKLKDSKPVAVKDIR